MAKTKGEAQRKILMIGNALQKGSTVYVYDEKGRTLYTKSGELAGYTGSTVSIKVNNTLYTYDERGLKKYSKSV